MFVHPLAGFLEEKMLAWERLAWPVEVGEPQRGIWARLEGETVAEMELEL